MSKIRKKKSPTREWFETILIATALALLIRSFIIEPFKTPSGSMEPTLKAGDKILVNKFTYGARVPFTKIFFPAITKPRIGDVMVFKYPVNPRRAFIKRVVGTEGDRVEIRGGNIFINGKILNTPPFSEFYFYAGGPYGEDEIIVPEGHYYVLGDNSSSSRDSRFWGFVPEENRIGRAFLIWWPPHRVGVLK
jgi:signal peptidase I